MATKICVGGLSNETTEKELENFFARHGAVTKVTITTTKELGISKIFGLVEMDRAEEAQKAITILSGKELGGKKITVNQARPHQDRGSGRTAYAQNTVRY